jgi:2-alkyl-3-oxoalkanoate reductase
MKQSILVHGADSFVGRHMVAALADSDWATPKPAATCDVAAIRDALRCSDAVVHCSLGSANEISRGASILYGAMGDVIGTRRVVHLGSMTVYGRSSGNITETSPTLVDSSSYAAAQLRAEEAARKQQNVLILRSGVEFGPDCPAWSGRIARLLYQRRLGDLGRYGDGVCNLIFIRDLMAVAIRALRLPGAQQDLFNVAMREKPTWNNYFISFALALGAVPVKRIARRQLAVDSKLLFLPLKMAELAATRLRLPVSRFSPALSPSLLTLCSQDASMQVDKSERTLGANWTNLPEALRATAVYYRQ